MKTELLNSCKYYKGEDKCPYVSDEGYVWGIEKRWIELSVDNQDRLDEIVEDFKVYGYGAIDVNIPLSLAALLLMNFYKQDGYIPMYTSNNDFELFHNKMYRAAK